MCALAALVSAATTPKVTFTDTKLENGLRVIIAEDYHAPVFSIAATYDSIARTGAPSYSCLFYARDNWSRATAMSTAAEITTVDIATRVSRCGWTAVEDRLDAHGWARVPKLLTPDECSGIASLYDDDARFRSHVVMARHGFGRGEYKYFKHPLPGTVADLRTALYPRLVPIANRWNEAMGIAVRYPDTHADFIDRCHQAGQTRPTPLLLRYREGDFNALHQDVYGEHLFPLQAMVLLSEPGKEFTGGEFVLTEQRPRMQSRVEVVPLGLGDGVIWAVRNRPVQGTRGAYRVTMRHGVSRLRSGRRHTVGVIFHDAK
jgi:hypothetical protein